MLDFLLRMGSQVTYRYVVLAANVPYAAFTEATVPVIEWEYDEVKEGGLNSYTHMLPSRRKRSTITLKNGVGSLALVDWYMINMQAMITRRSLTVMMVNYMFIPIVTYHMEDAWPAKWTGPQLKSGDGGGVAIQTVEFYGGEVTVVPGFGF